METTEDRWGNKLAATVRTEYQLPEGSILVEFSMFGQKMQQAIPGEHLSA